MRSFRTRTIFFRPKLFFVSVALISLSISSIAGINAPPSEELCEQLLKGEIRTFYSLKLKREKQGPPSLLVGLQHILGDTRAFLSGERTFEETFSYQEIFGDVLQMEGFRPKPKVVPTRTTFTVNWVGEEMFAPFVLRAIQTIDEWKVFLNGEWVLIQTVDKSPLFWVPKQYRDENAIRDLLADLESLHWKVKPRLKKMGDLRFDIEFTISLTGDGELEVSLSQTWNGEIVGRETSAAISANLRSLLARAADFYLNEGRP